MKPLNRLLSRSLAVLSLSVAGPWAALADPVTVTVQPNPGIAGGSVVFTIEPPIQPSDYFSIHFGDGTPNADWKWSAGLGWLAPCQSVDASSCGTVSHLYSAPGTYMIIYYGRVGAFGANFEGTFPVTVKNHMELNGIFVATAAHLNGYNNVDWRTDLEVQNAGPAQAKYSISLLARGQDNSTPAHAALTLDPGQSIRYTDILRTLFGFSGAGALCIVPTEGTVIATSRTYAQTGSGTYGTFVPAVARDNAIGLGQDGRLIGLSHDPSLAAGYRTNVGLVNPNSYPLTVETNFYLAGGTLLGTASYDLQPFEFRQVDRAFEQFTRERIEDGHVVVRITFAAESQALDGLTKLFAYASVVDNLTGDPTYVPAMPTARPDGNVGGSWSGTSDINPNWTWGDCAAHGNAWATFTQVGVWVTGTGHYVHNGGGCVQEFTFDGRLYGNALVGSTTSGSTTAPAQGTLAGDTLELAGWGFDLHLHR